MNRLNQKQTRKTTVIPMQKTASDPSPVPDSTDDADTSCGVDYFTFVTYPPPGPIRTLGQRRRPRKFTMSAHPDDFESYRAPTLDDMTRSCARRDPGYAAYVRRVVRRVVGAMGYSEEDLMDRKGCFTGYRWVVGLPGGGKVQFGTDRGRKGVRVELPGVVCRAIGTPRLRELMAWVLANDGHATRIDLAIDDFTKVKSPREVYESYRDGCAVTQARKRMWIESGSGPTGDDAETFYLGYQTGTKGKNTQRSRQELMVEDKNAESDGEVNSIRWELRCRDEVADATMRDLVNEENWPDVFATRLVSFADFCDPAKNKRNPERRPRLDWFKRLVGLVERAKSYAPRPIRTLAEKLSWFKRSGVPTLALLVKAGLLDPAEAVISGMRRWKPSDVALLEQALDMVPPPWDVDPPEWNIPPLRNMAPS